MCKYCDLEALEPDVFDTFFTSAVSDGFRSMVCKHCSTTFFTQPATLTGSPAEVMPQVTRKVEENSLVLLFH